MDGLTIGQFVERTGVPEGTLRMWERRYGFPSPERLPSGHRRYGEDEVALVRRVASERIGGTVVDGRDRACEGGGRLADAVGVRVAAPPPP